MKGFQVGGINKRAVFREGAALGNDVTVGATAVAFVSVSAGAGLSSGHLVTIRDSTTLGSPGASRRYIRLR